MSAPEHIWLHELHDGTTVWCADSNPSGDPAEAEHAVEYVRADLADTVANAARAYASNYLLDEYEDPAFTGTDPEQHALVVRLFDALGMDSRP